MSPNPKYPHPFWSSASLMLALMASLFLAGVAGAAGLGRMTVQSQLGQPFAAEIELINVSRGDAATLQAIPAPPAAYQAANMNFDQALNSLRLSIEQRANGSHYIRATTSRRIAEPFLNLLINLNTPDGRFQRGYSALLDLILMTDPRPAAPQPPVAAATAPGVTSGGMAQQPLSQPVSRPQRAARPAVAQSAAPSAAPKASTAAAAVTPAPAAPGNAAAAKPEAKPEAKPAEPAKVEPPKPATVEVAPPTAEAPKVPAESKAPAASATEPGAAAPEASAPVASAKPAAKPAAPAANAPGIGDTLMSNIVPVGGIVLAVLAALGGLWAVGRRKSAQPEGATAIEPSVKAEPFDRTLRATASDAAGASGPSARGAAPVGMAAAAAAAAAAVTAPEVTVANASDIVDPIDEARVYLEHMQDEPAEKILREALSKQPGREDVQMMLLEILAGRGDKDGFNQLASRLHKQTGGLGLQWKRAMAMGFALDPDYPLYSPTDAGAAPAVVMASPDFDVGSATPSADDFSNTTDILLNRDGAGIDMDKTMVLVPDADMDRTMVLVPDVAAPTSTAAAPEALPDIMFELPTASTPAPEKASAAAALKDDPGLDFKIDFTAPDTSGVPEAAADAPAAATADDAGWEAVQQKIELGRAYREMGDKDAALELLREAEREGDAGQQAEAREILQTLA